MEEMGVDVLKDDIEEYINVVRDLLTGFYYYEGYKKKAPVVNYPCSSCLFHMISASSLGLA